MKCDTHGEMADGTRLSFYEVLQLPIQLREVKIEETFVISQLSEDAILGMPFLAAHRRNLDFTKPASAYSRW